VAQVLPFIRAAHGVDGKAPIIEQASHERLSIEDAADYSQIDAPFRNHGKAAPLPYDTFA
jgi:hypothetical protein